MGRFISIFIAFITIAACADSSARRTVLLAHNLPSSHPVHLGMQVLADKLDSLSAGQMQVKIFTDGQLGSEREVLELLQIGSLSMTKVSAAAMSNFSPQYKVFGIPYLFRDKSHFFNVLEGPVGKEILEGGSEYLLKGLCYYDAGSRSFYTKSKPIQTPADLNGLKIRVMNDQMSVDMVNTLGGSATPMSYGELYTALQQGVVDGAENNPPSFVSSRHYEVCKYYTLDEHCALPDVLVIGTKFWNTLSDQEKTWLQQAADYSVEAQKEFWRMDVEKCMKILDEAGVTVIRPNKSEFSQKSEDILDQIKSDESMNALVEKIIQIQS